MKWLVYIAILFVPLFSTGQSGNTYVDVRLDTTVIRIGEQARLHVEVSYPRNGTVQWPAVSDTLTKHVEVVKDSGVDTADGTNGMMRQVRSLALTSFDSGFWAIPPFQFVVNGTPIATEALLLEVRTVPLDSTLALRDIHDIIELPFSLAYWARQHAAWIAGGVAVLVAIIILLYFLLRKKKSTTDRSEPRIVIPLHERILAALGDLEKQRVWQQGDHKAYHSRLTDLLRSYIEERFRVPAMESTTDELVKELRISPLNNEQRTHVENMLRLADMVKFAKAVPSPQENEQMMAGALRFVQDTAQRPMAPDHA